MLTIDLRMYRMSGIGRYLQNLVPLLINLVEANRIRVIGDPRQLRLDRWSHDSRVEVFASEAGIYGLQEQTLTLAGAVQNTDLLWVPHYNAPLLYTGRLAVTIHDVCHLALPESLGSSVKRSYARLLFANVARRADAIFCVSEFTAVEVQRYLHVIPRKIHVTHPGLDARWDINAQPYLDPEGVPYFLYVGNVKRNKNLRCLLEAFQKIMHQTPHHVVIVGKLDNMKNVDEAVIAEAQSMPERVHLTGEISDERLMQYYRGAEAFVFPSLYEGFGLPLLEAMSLKCPVLCSNTSSLPEVAGSAALYFNPLDSGDLAEKLLQIISSATLRSSLVEEGLTRVRQFSYERCAAQTAEVLNRILLEKKH